jgi:predicted phosphodiesterase
VAVRPRAWAALRFVLALLVGISGMWLALTAWGRSAHQVGPFELTLFSRPGVPRSEIELPPLGTILAASHLAPLQLTASLRSIDPERAASAVDETGLEAVSEQVRRDAPRAVRAHVVRSGLVALLGVTGAAFLVYRRRWRTVALATGAGAILVVLLASATYLTFRPEAFLEATYTGSLRTARDLLGPVGDAGVRLEGFRAELERFVGATVRAYGLVSQEPPSADAVAILHVSDIHSSPLGMDFAEDLATEFDVDLVVDTGDITTFGTPPERLILDRIEGFGVPYLFVRGNHDPYSVGARVESLPNGVTLENEATTVEGITFFGAPHPLFTPGGEMEEHEGVALEVARAGESLAARVGAQDPPADVLLVHDGRMAVASAGQVPLVLSGHFHDFAEETREGTLYLENGTTGGGGLDLFVGDTPVPLTAQILYVAGTPATLEAYDRVVFHPGTRELIVTRTRVEDAEAPISGASPLTPPGTLNT